MSLGGTACRFAPALRGVCSTAAPGFGSGAVFTGAVFTGAVFTGAVFTGAVFTGAVFTGAVFTGAVLAGAVLTGAGLAGAALRAASFGAGADALAGFLGGGAPFAAFLAGTRFNGFFGGAAFRIGFAALRAAFFTTFLGVPLRAALAGFRAGAFFTAFFAAVFFTDLADFFAGAFLAAGRDALFLAGFFVFFFVVPLPDALRAAVDVERPPATRAFRAVPGFPFFDCPFFELAVPVRSDRAAADRMVSTRARSRVRVCVAGDCSASPGFDPGRSAMLSS